MVPNVIKKMFPNIYTLLEEEDIEAISEQKLEANPKALLEYYLLFGFPDKAKTHSEETIRKFYMRTTAYRDVSFLRDTSKSIVDEYLKAKALLDINIENIPDIKEYFQIKILQQTPGALEYYLKKYTSETSSSDTGMLEILLAHQTNSLDELHKNIQVTKDSTTLEAWKRARIFIENLRKSPVRTLEDIIDTIPPMSLIPVDDALHCVGNKIEKSSIETTQMLVQALSYKKASDKKAIISNIEKYMEVKDIVKMLPGLRDKWCNGRLVFEIGSDKDDLFNEYKDVMKTKYFVITVNPVDMLFCSTDQEYQSCYSLLSIHGSNNGLPNFITQPSTAMCFLSSGSFSKPWTNDEYPGLSWKHVKIKARSFIFTSKDLDFMAAGRAYAPTEIQNAGINFNNSFRSTANLFFLKLLKEYGSTVDLSKHLTKKGLLYSINNFKTESDSNYRSAFYDLSFTMTPFIFRTLSGNTSFSETYLDNVKTDHDTNFTEYNQEVGRGSCGRYCCGNTLQDRYKEGLEQIKKGTSV